MAIKIFIDQGHNPSGPNTGAEGFGLKEQDITYQVGKDLAALLRADERFEVRLSRNTPEERLVGSEMCIRDSRKYTQSYYLAQHILNAVVNIVGTKDNGVRANPSLYVLRRTNMPAVLVELAYLTNAGDAGKLETMQSEFARGIYEGMLSYFGMDQ